MRTPLTKVRHPPMRIPSRTRTGSPPFTRDTSVVVPPISTITLLGLPASSIPPSTLAAGPQRMVSTGRRREKRSFIRLPSDRTTTTGAWMPIAEKDRRMASRNSRMIGTRRAFSSVPEARWTLSSPLNSSLPQTMGISVNSEKRRLASFSAMAPLFMAYFSTIPSPSACTEKSSAR